MAMDYASLKASVVLPLIEKFGKTVYLQASGTSALWTKSWDHGTGRYRWTNVSTEEVVYTDPTTVTETAGKAVEQQYRLEEIDNVTIKITDRKFITGSFDTVTTANKLIVGGLTLNIVNAQQVSPGDTALVWKLQCRA